MTSESSRKSLGGRRDISTDANLENGEVKLANLVRDTIQQRYNIK